MASPLPNKVDQTNTTPPPAAPAKQSFLGKHKVELLAAGAALLMIGGLVLVGCANNGIGAFGDSGSFSMGPVFAALGITFGSVGAVVGGGALAYMGYQSLQGRVQAAPGKDMEIELEDIVSDKSQAKPAAAQRAPDTAILDNTEADLAAQVLLDAEKKQKEEREAAAAQLLLAQQAAPDLQGDAAKPLVHAILNRAVPKGKPRKAPTLPKFEVSGQPKPVASAPVKEEQAAPEKQEKPASAQQTQQQQASALANAALAVKLKPTSSAASSASVPVKQEQPSASSSKVAEKTETSKKPLEIIPTSSPAKKRGWLKPTVTVLALAAIGANIYRNGEFPVFFKGLENMNGAINNGLFMAGNLFMEGIRKESNDFFNS